MQDQLISKKKYLLDAGHGGINSNGRYTSGEKKKYHFVGIPDPRHETKEGEKQKDLIIYEGEINRNIVARVCSLLDAKNIDNTIIFDPVEDDSLAMRRAKANSIIVKERARTGRDLVLISVHCNASGDKLSGKGRKARGAEIYTLRGEDASDPIAEVFGKKFKTAFKEIKFRADTWSDGDLDKEANFGILKAKLPSILIEVEFYDNLDAAKLLIDPAFIEKVAKWIVKSILAVEKMEIKWTY